MHLNFRVGLLIALGLVVLLPVSCTTDVDINAEPQDIWAVYGTLNPTDSVQDIRIASGFLPEGNAEDAAATLDLSLRGLLVVLRSGGQEWVATQVDSVQKEPGTFFEYQTIYRFETQGSNALEPGETYQLIVTRPDDASFELRSSTTIPDAINFSSPVVTPGPGGQRCLRQVSLENEYKIVFSRGDALGFEIRAYLDYTEDGISKQAVYGPTRMFTDGVRCLEEGSTMCYQFRDGEILRDLFNDMSPVPSRDYRYGVTEATRCNDNPEDLPDAFRFEVTAVDSAIATYRIANDPAFVDLNTVRNEYTNISGNGITIGVFGSVNTGTASAQLSPCAMYLLQLNDTPAPVSPCEF